MGIFSKSEKKVIKELLKASNKKEKEIEKDFIKRNSTKYNKENLELAKNMMLHNAMTIDAEEYKQIVNQLKKVTVNEDIPE